MLHSPGQSLVLISWKAECTLWPVWSTQPLLGVHTPVIQPIVHLTARQSVCLTVSHFTETAILASTLFIKDLASNERISRSLNHPVYIKFIYNFNPW